MKLSTYLKANKVSAAEFAKLVGASRSAVCRWSKGERTPTSKHMPEIIKATNGNVQPNDFFEAA